ncbi:hypothetical protein ALC57_18124, partial [Trachymyrmex cornetzi]
VENHERVERELLEQCGQVATLVECFAWLQRCDKCIERLEELCCAKRPLLAIGHRQSMVARIARLAGAKSQLERRFVHVDAVEKYGNVKVNTASNGEFTTNDKRINGCINTKNSEKYGCTDLCEWFDRHVESTLASLEEFQEHGSGWARCEFSTKMNRYFLCGDKRNKHVNVLYLQDSRNESLGHFAWIKNQSLLVRSQITIKKTKKYFLERKLQTRAVDCFKINNRAIRLPNEDDKWLCFNNHRNKEHVPFIIYYRGPAHSNCNLNYKNSFYIPVVFHNLSGYDAHFIIKEIATTYDGLIDLFPITKEVLRMRVKNGVEKNLYKLMNEANNFVEKEKTEISLIGAKNVFNSDQSGFNLEMHTGHTLAARQMNPLSAEMDRLAVVKCAWCAKSLCIKDFLIEYHFCKEYV